MLKPFHGALAVSLFIISSCHSRSEQNAEVRSISTAIDRLRQAPNPEKAPLLSELSRVPCSLKDVCELRDRCVGAYREQVEALDEIASISAAKNEPHVPDADRIVAVEHRLERARKLAQECLENELVVGRRYGTQI